MKLKQMMFGAACAATLVFGAVTASAISGADYPLVKLAMSGTVYYASNNIGVDSYLRLTNVPLNKVSFAASNFFALFNASAAAMTDIHTYATVGGVTGTTSTIPAGSFVVWNPYEETLTITNTNTFSWTPDDNGGDGIYFIMDIEDDNLTGTYSTNSTGAGTETDVTGTYFEFSDENNNYIELYGKATLTWTYAAVGGGGNQSTTLSATITGASDDYSEVKDYDAVTTTFTATGIGTMPLFPSADVPFFYNY